MILYNAVSMRLRDRTDVGGQIADLSRGTADLARQVAEFGRRLSTIEGRIVSANSAGADRFQSVVGEINELGALVKQLAASVASHEDRLATRIESHTEKRVGDDEPHREQPHSSDGKVVAAAPAPASIGETTASRSQGQTLAAVRAAVEENRIDIYLQPMVTLPQRKVRYYEAVTRLRDDKDQILIAEDFIGIAEAAGLIGRIDNMVMLRCVQVLRRLMVRNKDVGIFCNVSATTLGNSASFAQCLDFLEANRALAPSFVLEFKQSTFRKLGPTETDHLAALAQRGYRFSIDHVTDLRIEPRELADRGVRFIKVPASLLLDPKQMSASDIHPSDMSDLLGRFGIDLIAERIEGERAVVDLLDYDVRFGQGFLFAPPRPLRPEGAAGATQPQSAPGKMQEARSQEIQASPSGPGRAAPLEIAAIEPAAPRASGNAALARRVAGPAA
jgi:cyclic-di-GMP phosphodiesterase TipF (flagellum assembly factor)